MKKHADTSVPAILHVLLTHFNTNSINTAYAQKWRTALSNGIALTRLPRPHT